MRCLKGCKKFTEKDESESIIIVGRDYLKHRNIKNNPDDDDEKEDGGKPQPPPPPNKPAPSASFLYNSPVDNVMQNEQETPISCSFTDDNSIPAKSSCVISPGIDPRIHCSFLLICCIIENYVSIRKQH